MTEKNLVTAIRNGLANPVSGHAHGLTVVSESVTRKRNIPKRTPKRGVKFTDLAMSFFNTSGFNFGDSFTPEAFDEWLMENGHIDCIPEVGDPAREGHLAIRNTIRDQINKGAVSVEMPIDKRFQLVCETHGMYEFRKPLDHLDAEISDLAEKLLSAWDANLRNIEKMIPDDDHYASLGAIEVDAIQQAIEAVRESDHRCQMEMTFLKNRIVNVKARFARAMEQAELRRQKYLQLEKLDSI